MATTFLEPGGDADFLIGTTNGFWTSTTGVPAIGTDFVHGAHIKSIKYQLTTNYVIKNSITNDTGTRISLYVYFNAFPSSSYSVIVASTDGGSAGVELKITSGGILQLARWDTDAQIGSNGNTLSTGQWYRISLAYTITSTTVNRFEVFVNGISSISVTNATIGGIGGTKLQIGNMSGATNLDMRSSDHYIDDSSSLTDPGNIWVTAKRPNANGTLNEFTTQVGSGGSGVGTGHSPQVNERPLSATNGWEISNTTVKTEEYTIEAKIAGDIDISSATIVDYMGWISANVGSLSNSPVHHIIVGGTATLLTPTAGTVMYTAIKNSSTYPTGNTDIGMDAAYTTTPHTTSLFECGIIVAYIPATTSGYLLPGMASLNNSS